MRVLLPASVLLLLGLAASGCEGDNPVASPLVTELPRNFRLTGTASGAEASGLAATCSLDWIFELTSEVSHTPERIDYEGVHGGGVERSVLARDGSGFVFAADVFGEVRAHVDADGTVEISIPVNETADGRFWRNLARFTGTIASSGSGRGEWTCAPMDIDSGGYVDESLSVTGSWGLEASGGDE